MYQQEREARERLEKDEADAVRAKGAGRSNESERRAQAEQAMRAYFEQILIDPSSAQFRNVQVFLDVPGSKLRTRGSKATTPLVDVVCGEVNSKNRMGGYVGFRHFYWDSDERKAIGPLDDRDLGPIIEDLARRTCAGLK